MKKLTIELPDWAEGKPIHVTMWKRGLMYVSPDRTAIYRKTKECIWCGKCCQKDETWVYPLKEIDGKMYCRFVEIHDGVFNCMFGNAPWGCAVDNHETNFKNHPECAIEYEKVEQ